MGHYQSVYDSLPAVVSAQASVKECSTGCESKNRACLVIKNFNCGLCYASAASYKLTRLSIDGGVWPVLCQPRGSNCCQREWVDTYQRVNLSLFAPALEEIFPLGLDNTQI